MHIELFLIYWTMMAALTSTVISASVSWQVRQLLRQLQDQQHKPAASLPSDGIQPLQPD